MRHIRSNVVGYVALFFALSAGAYAAGLAPDSVRSKHIKNGQVKTQDVADDSLDQLDVRDGGLGGPDIADGSLGSPEFPNDALNGGDIAEATLGTVPAAAQGGTGRYASQGSCDPESEFFIQCSSVTVPHSKPGRLLIIGTATADTESGANQAIGRCLLELDGSPIPGAATSLFFHDPGSQSTANETVTLVAVSDVLPAGSQRVGVKCNQSESAGAINYRVVRVVGVALSDG